MKDSAELQRLYEVADDFSKRLVSCNGCTKCCESGIVYVLPEEKSRLESLGAQLINIDGVDYIKRENGVCSMLDRQHSRCSIEFYKNRPLCCRLFPLDVFNRDYQTKWGVYNYCPSEKLNPILLTGSEPRINLFILSIMISRLEKNIPKRVLNFLANEDKVTAEIELLDKHNDDFLLLDRVAGIY
jgi:Fe-S-cluster containining protein